LKEALARFVLSKKQIKNRVYSSPRIYLPMKLVSDSSFPFKGDEVFVFVKIKNRKLIIQKASKKVLMKYNRIQKED
jgi:hypothetical protein